MLLRSTPWLRVSVVAMAGLALAVAAVGGASAPTTAPTISAASEMASSESSVSDLAQASQWPESTTVPATDGPATAAVGPVTDVSATATIGPTTDVSATATIGPATVVAPGLTRSTTAAVEPIVGDPRGADALALIAFPWRRSLPGWSISFLPAKVGLRGLTRVDDHRIEIYVRDGDSAASLARVVAHELGHAADVELNSQGDRERWRAARGVGPTVSWWPGNAASDFDTLSGDFAEAFATMLTGSTSLSRIAPPPGPAELAVLAELVPALEETAARAASKK